MNVLILGSTRVSNELGAGNSDRARHAMSVTLKLTLLLALVVVSALSFGHNLWAASFSDSPLIIAKFASMTPLLVASLLCDFVQGILSGMLSSPTLIFNFKWPYDSFFDWILRFTFVFNYLFIQINSLLIRIKIPKDYISLFIIIWLINKLPIII